MTDRPFGTTATQPEPSTTDVAKDQAKSVAGDAKEGGQQVAQTAKEQTQQVASEAKYQARDLYDQVRGELGDQAANQHQRAASGLRSLGDELGFLLATWDLEALAERCDDLVRAGTLPLPRGDWHDIPWPPF